MPAELVAKVKKAQTFDTGFTVGEYLEWLHEQGN